MAAGDVTPRLSEEAIEGERAGRATTRAQTVAALALGDVLKRHAEGGAFPPGAPGEWLAEVRALVDGASPDEVRALRRVLFSRADGAEGGEAGRRPDGVDPDIELAAGWREGGYPYENLMSRKNYERQKYRLQVELLKLQAWVKRESVSSPAQRVHRFGTIGAGRDHGFR